MHIKLLLLQLILGLCFSQTISAQDIIYPQVIEYAPMPEVILDFPSSQFQPLEIVHSTPLPSNAMPIRLAQDIVPSTRPAVLLGKNNLKYNQGSIHENAHIFLIAGSKD